MARSKKNPIVSQSTPLAVQHKCGKTTEAPFFTDTFLPAHFATTDELDSAVRDLARGFAAKHCPDMLKTENYEEYDDFFMTILNWGIEHGKDLREQEIQNPPKSPDFQDKLQQIILKLGEVSKDKAQPYLEKEEKRRRETHEYHGAVYGRDEGRGVWVAKREKALIDLFKMVDAKIAAHPGMNAKEACNIVHQLHRQSTTEKISARSFYEKFSKWQNGLWPKH